MFLPELKLTQCLCGPVTFYPGGPLLFDPFPKVVPETVVDEHLAREVLTDTRIGKVGTAMRHIGDEGDENVVGGEHGDVERIISDGRLQMSVMLVGTQRTYVGDDERVQLRVNVPAEKIIIVSGLVGDENQLLSARIDDGAGCSAFDNPRYLLAPRRRRAEAMGRQPRQPQRNTHSLVRQPQTAPRCVTAFRTLDGRRDLELNFGSVSGGQEVFAEMDGSPLGAFWDGVARHGGGRWMMVRSSELLIEIQRNAD